MTGSVTIINQHFMTNKGSRYLMNLLRMEKAQVNSLRNENQRLVDMITRLESKHIMLYDKNFFKAFKGFWSLWKNKK